MVLSIEERKEKLSKLANSEFTRQFHASDAITAIDTLNKMDNLYKQKVEVEHKVVHTFIFRLPDGTNFTPGLPQQPLPLRLVNQQDEVVEGEVIERGGDKL